MCNERENHLEKEFVFCMWVAERKIKKIVSKNLPL